MYILCTFISIETICKVLMKLTYDYYLFIDAEITVKLLNSYVTSVNVS